MHSPKLTLNPLPEVLQNKDVRDILSAFARVGEEARLIGGCVRDTLLKIPITDMDIATTALPERSGEILLSAGFAVKPIGIEHGVVLAVRDGHKYEIATLREDMQTDGRHAVVAFTRDWQLDAERRDFTINALSMDADGQVYDYNNGIEDLREPRVRFIGYPARRVMEDYLRILRYYRFVTRFGGDWDVDARAVCRSHRAGIKQLSQERITGEIIKLLSSENPLQGVRAMTEDHIFVETLATLVDVASLERLLAREKVYGAGGWPLRLAAWGGMAKYFFEEILLSPFGLPRAQHQAITEFATMDLSTPITHNLYHYGKAAVRGAVMLRAPDADLPGLMAQIENFNPQKFPLAGEDLLQMGVAAGPRLGEILRATENWWLEGGCAAGREECLNYAGLQVAVEGKA
jgi:poly(A) polymerase